MNNKFNPARFNLANLYNSQGRNEGAEQQLRQILELAHDNGEAYYSLGLLLAELNRLEEAADYLAKAAELLPTQRRVHYNYGLTLQHLGRSTEAEVALLKAHQLDSHDPNIIYALAVFYMQQRQWDRALPYAEQLTHIYPGATEPRRLLNQIQLKMIQKSTR